MLLLSLLYMECFRNGAAAYHQVSLVQYNGLTRGDGPLGCVKHHLNMAVLLRVYGGSLLELTVAGFRGDPQRLRQGREGVPVHILCPQCIGQQGLAGTYGHGVLLHILGTDVYRRTQSNAQSFSLAQGIADSATVFSNNSTVQIQIVTGRVGLAGVPLHE